MAGVTLSGVTKRFGQVVAVDTVDLEILDGEFMVLVGPSGCGKSTVLRMIAGLEELSDGTVEIAGRVVNDVAPKNRDIAMVFQSYALYPHMTVRENLEFGLRIRHTPREEMESRVRDAAQILGIGELLERRPRELSGGQRQRVALGRAIVRMPSLFLFDEPLSNLDAKLRVQMRAELSKLHKRLGTTVVYVTHDQVEAMTMGDRIAVLEAGRMQQVGPPLEVYERPANAFVAGFIGTPPMNLLEARVSDDGARLVGDGFDLPVPAVHRGQAAGEAVVLGIRPENLYLSPEQARGETAPLTLTIEIVETLGHDAIAHGRVGAELVSASLDPHFTAEPGETVELAVELDSVHLFDAETRLRLGAPP
jgi:multiple sugar transport system ATP-binding protein